MILISAKTRVFELSVAERILRIFLNSIKSEAAASLGTYGESQAGSWAGPIVGLWGRNPIRREERLYKLTANFKHFCNKFEFIQLVSWLISALCMFHLFSNSKSCPTVRPTAITSVWYCRDIYSVNSSHNQITTDASQHRGCFGLHISKFRAPHFYRAKLRVARYCQGKLSVRLSIRLDVTWRYRDHIGWNSWKIISRLITVISLTFPLSVGKIVDFRQFSLPHSYSG